ncbi:MAG: HlyD family efflux transporter periplasmic adaptor subunit [Planctomycetes bacterium]|nr:HlyD family efflux transporter periplasmic adaptor subunit [Planctomycetota bacterium]
MSAPQPILQKQSPLAAARSSVRAVIPLAVWLATAAALVPLSQAAPSANRSPALVDAQASAVLAPVSGRVITIAVQLHQLVEANAVVARFDDRDVRLRLAKAQFELERLRADMAHAEAEVERASRADTTAIQLEASTEYRRLVSAVEQAQLAALSTRTDLEEARVRMQGAAIETERLTGLVEQGMIGQPQLVAMRTDRDALTKRIEELEGLYDRQRAVVATTTKRLEEFMPGKAATLPVDTALAPLRWRLKEQEAELERIALDAQALDLRAPMRGHVAAIGASAGEWLPVGTEVATVVDATPRRVLAYVTATARGQIEQARALELQRPDASPLGETRIISVSPTTVRVPERFWRDPQREEWAYEVVLAATGQELPGEHVLLASRR